MKYTLKFSRTCFLVALTSVLVWGCKKKWDDHNAIADANTAQNLFERISTRQGLSKFTSLLVKSGYDKIVASSKTFTVFAPTNEALATLSPGIESDTAMLRKFVENHITYQTYFTPDISGTTRIAMLSGKYHDLTSNSIDNASVTTPDLFANNGALQVINQMLPVLENTWDFVENNPLMPVHQKTYLLSIFRNVFDPTNAVQTGIDSLGLPIYQAGTDSISTNQFWRNVHDLRNEEKKYTFFVLADNNWDAEVDKFKPYFNTGMADSTAGLAAWEVVKDFAVDTLYDNPATVPDSVISKFGVKLGIEKAQVAQTIKTSNGIVYVMNKIEVTPRGKFQDYVIQAETGWVASANRLGNTYIRERLDSSTGRTFKDIVVWNHGLGRFNLRYRLRGVPALKYRAYWVALNDNLNGITTTFTQKIGVGTFDSAEPAYATVALRTYTEQFAGEFTLNAYNPILDIFLTAANTSVAATNAIVCDYIRLEPVF